MIREELAEINESMILLDGFDEAIIGYVDRFGDETVALYDKDKVIEILSRDMTYEEAIEYFDYNIAGTYLGHHTPAFATLIKQE